LIVVPELMNIQHHFFCYKSNLELVNSLALFDKVVVQSFDFRLVEVINTDLYHFFYHLLHFADHITNSEHIFHFLLLLVLLLLDLPHQLFDLLLVFFLRPLIFIFDTSELILDVFYFVHIVIIVFFELDVMQIHFLVPFVVLSKTVVYYLQINYQLTFKA